MSQGNRARTLCSGFLLLDVLIREQSAKDLNRRLSLLGSWLKSSRRLLVGVKTMVALRWHHPGKWQMIVVETMARMARMVWLGRISASQGWYGSDGRPYIGRPVKAIPLLNMANARETALSSSMSS